MSKGRIFRPKGKNFLMVAYCAPGPDGKVREVRESARTLDERKAGELLTKRLREVENHRAHVRKFEGPRAQRIKVAALLDALVSHYTANGMKSLSTAVYHLRPIREHFGSRRAAHVTTQLVRGYIERRRAEGYAPATVNRETELLGRAFKLAVEDGVLGYCPKIPALPEDNARKGFFEPHEIESLLPHLPTPIDDATRFAYICGWRRGEILPLAWSQVDRAAREVRLYTSKNSDPRTLPLDDEDWRLFERLWARREYRTPDGTTALSTYVFHRNGRPIDRKVFGEQWRRACRTVGLDGKLFHDLRRTAARNMIRGGVSQTVAMKITGHRTISMFQRYDITANEDKLDALRRRRSYVEGRTDAGSNVRPLRAEVRTPRSDPAV